MSRLALLAIAALVHASACSKSPSERCSEVCQLEADCAEKLSKGDENYPYDADECTTACVNLERDSQGKKAVDAHVDCAMAAADDCTALQNCRLSPIPQATDS